MNRLKGVNRTQPCLLFFHKFIYRLRKGWRINAGALPSDGNPHHDNDKNHSEDNQSATLA